MMLRHACVGAAGVLVCASAGLAQFSVSSTSPSLNANNVPGSAPIVVHFDRTLNTSTFSVENFHVFGKVSGPIAGTVSFSNADQTVTFQPMRSFIAGEQVMVTMSNALRAADGSFLRAQGYQFTFTVAVAPSFHKFRQINVISNRDSTGAQTRIYGGLACDLNSDGWCDMTTINEVSADLRVFLNNASGSGPFGPMLPGYTPIPYESSPNEVGDFDRDGFIDVVVSSNATSQIAIAWGNGDGTFDAPTVINVGNYARGIGILDADGDGDLDIAVACTSSNRVDLLRSTGGRNFAPLTSTSVAGGPYGMHAADMNNDGILDLAVGTVNSQEALVLRGNGNGTFTPLARRSLGGTNWVVVCGDVNNDGFMDMSCANASSLNGSMLLGNGNGTLQPATVVHLNGHTVSTDLADLDGDGDLDWVLSSFGAGRWFLRLNNGDGTFVAVEEFPAPANPSCAVPMDIDNDGDIDLVLTDEIADVMLVLENHCSIDFNNDGLYPDTLDVDDFLSVFAGGPCSNGPDCESIDFNNDGLFPDTADIDAILRLFSGGACQ